MKSVPTSLRSCFFLLIILIYSNTASFAQRSNPNEGSPDTHGTIQTDDYVCENNLLQNPGFDAPGTPWHVLSGTAPIYLDTTASVGCYTSGKAAVLATQVNYAPAAIEQNVSFTAGQFYSLVLPVKSIRPGLVNSKLEIWAATTDNSINYNSLLNGTYAQGAAQLVGSFLVLSNGDCKIFSQVWQAQANYSRVILLIKPLLPNFATEVLVDNVCITTSDFHPSVCDSLQVDFSYASDGLSVQFSLESSLGTQGKIDSVRWTFFNNTANAMLDTSTSSNPVYQFPAFGWYSVCLFVEASSNGEKCQRTICKDVWVEQNCPDLQADFADSLYELNNRVQFSDLSRFPSGTIASWKWDFGDGTRSTLQNPAHSYQSEGIYLVCLIVGGKQEEGGAFICDDTLCRFIEVKEDVCSCSKLEADFTYSLDTATRTVQFTNQTAPVCGAISNVEWIFGNGATSNLLNPSYTFDTGVYYVCLRVTTSLPDGSACERQVCKMISIPGVSSVSPLANRSPEPDLKVFPNPTDGQLNIELNGSKVNNVQVFNMIGKKMMETSETSLDVSAFPAGIYYLKVNGRTTKFIKQ